MYNRFSRWLLEEACLSKIEIARYVNHLTYHTSKQHLGQIRWLHCDGIRTAKNGQYLFLIESEINEVDSHENWREIPGISNPADVLSRGCTPQQLLGLKWYEGPVWLRKDSGDWPMTKIDCEVKELDVTLVVQYPIIRSFIALSDHRNLVIMVTIPWFVLLSPGQTEDSPCGGTDAR
ncbi:hypothetical protein TNCV_2079431 [Trichonephila clavipes]|nr:hypothetical protein TNCV_2079431 [Trichonephila clavipes]